MFSCARALWESKPTENKITTTGNQLRQNNRIGPPKGDRVFLCARSSEGLALSPGIVGRNQISSQEALWRRGQPSLHFFRIELEMRRLTVRFQCSLVLIHLVVVKPVWIVFVLQHVKTQAAGFILFRMLSVVTYSLQVLRQIFGLDLNHHLQSDHAAPPRSKSSSRERRPKYRKYFVGICDPGLE